MMTLTPDDDDVDNFTGCGTSCQTTLNSHQVKTYSVRFLKPFI